MTNQILQTYYQRMLPRYTPQAEKFIKTAEPAVLNRVSFRYIFSVAAMTHISRIIEDTVLANPRTAALHVSFQHMSRLLPQQARYEQLSQSALGLWLYGVNDIPPATFTFMPRTTLIDTVDTALTRYWFAVAYGAGIGMTLLAEEVSSSNDEGRYYEGFYTFEPEVAYQVVRILHQRYPDRVPQPLTPTQLLVR
jgi:DICT domain-containing protein